MNNIVEGNLSTQHPKRCRDPNDWKSKRSKLSCLLHASQEISPGSNKSYYANNSFVHQTAKEEHFVIMFEVQDNYSHVIELLKVFEQTQFDINCLGVKKLQKQKQVWKYKVTYNYSSKKTCSDPPTFRMSSSTLFFIYSVSLTEGTTPTNIDKIHI